MKKQIIYSLLFLSLASFVNAQVGVEREDVREDGLMDFPENATKGILLPRLVNTADVADKSKVGGALAFNVDAKRIEYYNESKWIPMTSEGTEVPSTYLQQKKEDDSEYAEVGTGVLITDKDDSASTNAGNAGNAGVLVLDSDSKALILPQVEDVTELPNPTAGLICYDKLTKSFPNSSNLPLQIISAVLFLHFDVQICLSACALY